MTAWRWALPALSLLAAGCGVTGDRCAELSDEEAKEFATKGLRDSFEHRRPGDMLGPYRVGQLLALKVERHDYGKGNQMTHIAVHFYGPSRRHVIKARIFPDCGMEWRPQPADGQG